MTPLLLALGLSTAAFNGVWVGNGQAQFHGRPPQPCQMIGLSLDGAERFFRVRGGGYDCDDLKASYDPYTLDIRDLGLWSGQTAMGSVDANGDGIHIVSTHPDFTFYLDLVLHSGADSVTPTAQITYRERWISDGVEQLSVSGELAPRN